VCAYERTKARLDEWDDLDIFTYIDPLTVSRHVNEENPRRSTRMDIHVKGELFVQIDRRIPYEYCIGRVLWR